MSLARSKVTFTAADLDAYAEEHKKKPGPPCWLCGIPERQLIEEGRKRGKTYLTLVGFLVERCGYPKDVATYSRVSSHLQDHLA